MPDRSSQTFGFPCSGRQEQLRSRFHPNFATTFRKQENAFFGACKMHFCRRPKIHTAPKTNAFTGARKMHFATLPKRMLCADTVSKSNRSCECGLWALVYLGSVDCRGVPNPKDYRETLCPTPARDYRETPWTAQPQRLRPAGVPNRETHAVMPASGVTSWIVE